MKKIISVLFLFFASNAFAIDQMYNWNGLEFVTSGNVTHVHPASPESTKLRGGWVLDISDVEPKSTATHNYPLKHSSNPPAKVSVNWPIDPKKVTDAASKAASAAVAGAATGNGYLTLGLVACSLICEPLVTALADWGGDKLSLNSDGSLSVHSLDSGLVTSTGYLWQSPYGGAYKYPTPAAACASAWPAIVFAPYPDGPDSQTCHSDAAGGSLGTVYRKASSSCPAGNFIDKAGACYSPTAAPTVSVPLETYIESNYTGKGWSRHWAELTAGLVAAGENVFTDGTGTTITGPAIVPVSVTETQTQINVVPGTTTPVSPGHTGPSDSATQTIRSTTNAHNNYRPGSASSGPSMTTTQKTTTTTSITNNVTNVTNITNTTETEVDKAPEETVSDTPLPEIPSLYEQKYPNGLSGVVTSKVQQLKETPLFRLPSNLMGDLPSNGQCPSWQLDLNLSSWAPLGVYDIGADCSIWEFASLVVLISALILCRALIFGG